MKNLELWHVNVRNLITNSEDHLATCCYGHGEGNFTGELYSCSHNLIVSNFGDDGEIKWSKDLTEVASPENSPVNITYLSLSNALCVGLANGELYTISDGNSCELAGVCQAGLLAMEWSPDQELLVLVTKDMNTILMSCTFDPIHETNILDQEFGEQQFITVGWGKKETQFHGSEGKQAAKLKTEISADPNADANNAVKITWRGDGNLYAVGFLTDGIRRFKVFDREGHLQYTSEKQPDLESNLSWRPSGNVIATTQKVNDKYMVAFFEKNGLKHGGFDIPVDAQTEVQDLAWSSDSEIIALQCYSSATNSHSVLLFTTGNYHWYLKQTLTFNSYQKISKMIWDNDFDVANNKKLHLVLSNGQHYTYSWIWNINHSRGKCDADDAVVNVIDAKKVLATGFRQTVVPPPMASLEIVLDSFVNSVHFAPDVKDTGLDPNTFFVCTTDGNLAFYKQICKFPLKYELYKTLSLDKYNFPFQYYNWFWLNTDTVLCTEVDNNNNNFLTEYSIKSDEITKINTESLPESMARIQPHPTDNTAAFLQLMNGDIMQYNLGGSMVPQDASFSVPCPVFDIVALNDNIHFLSLSHKGTLYLDDEKILNNVSSFYVHTHFLLLTTLQHVLLCVELTPAGLNALKEYQKNESTDVYKRKIERGAKLVIAVPNDTRTVFQMPRGNLEGIQPRPLSLKIIGEYLDECKYYEAFDLMRKQRINLNLIYDHDPEKLEHSMDIFLETIQNNTWLSLFLSDLENADVTKSMYSSSYVEKKDVKRESGTKIKRICETIRTNLSKRPDKSMKILPILTTYVKINTVEDMESALTVVKDLKLQESAGSKLPVSSDEALKYLLYMVDVNHLFDVALGMYDFDLVLLVANKSQKDPKEYVPTLNDFNAMEENYRRFSINKHLKRFARAVQCLAGCGKERYDELRTFVKYHSLYREALRLFTPGDEIYKEIADDFGLHLKLKKQYTEAGIIYERASKIDKAIECYKDGLEWELVMKLLCNKPKEEHSIVCWELANGLKDDKRYKEGLMLLEQFCDDKEEIVKYALEGRQFKTALRLCSQHQLGEVKDNQFLPALMEEYGNLQQLIESNWNTFTKHRERLFVVRVNKKNAPEIDLSYANKDSDLYSDAGSTVASSASRSSGRTFRSSKNRRKHERKVASLKEGSQYEDVALVMALHHLITSSFDLRLQAKEVNTALSCVDLDREAFLLQTCLEKLLKEMKDSFKDIWTNELVIEATNAAIAALNVPEGCSVLPQGIGSLEPHMRIAPIIHDINWKLEGLN